MDISCVITANITIKSHPTDNSKVIIRVNGTDYTVDGKDVIVASTACMNN